ncbi:MAG: hypothetical protein J4F37_01425 [Acidobacteria bacterium]|nr:hypothetical protein [Acidobacteriota bacterium]
MVELRGDELVFRFPEVHAAAVCRIGFQRTLRIPDDNRDYPLPPGLGRFPLRRVDDHLDRAPDGWGRHGGVFLPMYQAESLWLHFSTSYPMAVKVAAGKVDAVTGEGWTDELSPRPQNYLAVPDQPWLDGFCVGKGLIRQFVAMPLGRGFTAEEQLTGEAQHGGLQIVVYPMQAARYEAWQKERSERLVSYGPVAGADPSGPAEMGLAPGGLMRQQIYRDEYGFDAWARAARSRCFVHILNSVQFLRVSGAAPPAKPPTAREYSDAGLPWFEHYGGDLTALDGARKLAGLDSVAAMKLKKGEGVLADNDPVQPAPPTIVRTSGAHRVREGEF